MAMRKRLPLVAFLVLTLVVMLVHFLALAGAVQPDPVWIPGLYDDGDYDGLLLVVTSPDSSVTPSPLYTSFEIILVAVGTIPLVYAGRPHVIALPTVSIRSPPIF